MGTYGEALYVKSSMYLNNLLYDNYAEISTAPFGTI